MILVVRHGPGRGRGRRGPYMQAALAHLRERRPALFAELRFHETGRPAPALAGLRAVVFWLADPLRESYPGCYAEAEALWKEAEQRGLPGVNPPAALSNSVKSTQARLWQEAGIPSPPLLRFRSREERDRALARASFPVLLRSDRQHTQRGMFVCHDRAEVETAGAGSAIRPDALAPLVDLREGHRRADPASVWAGHHHKKRALVLGRRVFHHEVLFSESPVVTSQTCTFRRYARGPRRWLAGLGLGLRSEAPRLAADLAYWRENRPGPPELDALLRRAVETLGLGWAAIDYAVGADGRPLLWEANPYFTLPAVERMYLPGPRRIPERQEEVYAAVGDFFADLLEGAGGPAPGA